MADASATSSCRLVTKPSVDRLLLRHAFDWASESVCRRNQVGAVLASEGRSVSTGYSGSPRGLPPCCTSSESPCSRAVHAESNALIYAAREGIRTVGCTMYCTLSPCLSCAGLMINGGIVRVVYVNDYRDLSGIHMLKEAEIEVEKHDNPVHQ